MQDKSSSPTGQSSTSGANRSGFTLSDDPMGGDPTAATASGRSSGAGPSGERSRSTGPTTGGDTLTQAKQTISNVATQASDKVASRLDTQKDRAAEGLGTVAQALRQTGDQLREQNQGSGVHQYVASAADQVERLSGYLRSTNTRELVSGVERFAREQPALFVGGAFMLGLLGARFLKSSGHGATGYASIPRSRSMVAEGDYRATGMYGQDYAGSTGTGEYGRRAAPTGLNSAEDI